MEGKRGHGMSLCKDCIHYAICDIMADQYGIPTVPSSQCGFYKNATDVVEVVRCKECKNCVESEKTNRLFCIYNHEGDIEVFADHYCSWGERREG